MRSSCMLSVSSDGMCTLCCKTMAIEELGKPIVSRAGIAGRGATGWPIPDEPVADDLIARCNIIAPAASRTHMIVTTAGTSSWRPLGGP